MDTRTLGKSDLAVTRIGIGTAPIGSVPGVWWVNWGHQDERDSLRAIHAAIDGGINWIDTAPFYGWGRAEEVVGKALDGRNDVLVFTKCGTMPRGRRRLHGSSSRGDPRRSRRQPAPCAGRPSTSCSCTTSTERSRSRKPGVRCRS